VLVAVFWSQKIKWFVFPVVIGVFLLLLVFVTKSFNTISSNYASNPATRILFVNDKSGVSERSKIYLASLKMLVDKPMIGEAQFLDVLNKRLGFSAREITHSHNTFFQFAASGGLLTLASFFLVLFCLLARAGMQRNGYLLLFLCGYLTVNLFDHLFFFAPLHAAFWLAAGVVGNPYRGPVQVKSGGSAAA
jgi:O-antigen ligase